MIVERGILFDEIHSYHDLNLILSGSTIEPAEPKTTYIDIAGGDGSADLTEANGEVRFKDRTLKFTFTMNPADDLSDDAWEEKKTEISNLLNGKYCKITREVDPDYYYQGRCTVDEFKSDKRLRQFVISAQVRPYKLKQNKTKVIVDVTTAMTSLNLTNGRKSVVPVVKCSTDNTAILFKGHEVVLSAGTHQILDLYLKEGITPVEIYLLDKDSTGTVTFEYQEGDL